MAEGLAGGKAGSGSGDDVGGQSPVELSDLVAQSQLLLLQPRDLKLVGRSLGFEGVHGVIEVLMGLAKSRELDAKRGVRIVVLRLVVHRARILAEPAPSAILTPALRSGRRQVRDRLRLSGRPSRLP
jgi:hypothetical protein